MLVVAVPTLTLQATLLSSTANKFILDRKDIPGDPNAYVYRDPRRGNGRWSIYFYDRETKERHRLVLKKPDGTYPTPTIEAQASSIVGLCSFRCTRYGSKTSVYQVLTVR